MPKRRLDMRQFILILGMIFFCLPVWPRAGDFGLGALPFGDSGAGFPSFDIGLETPSLIKAELLPEMPEVSPGVPFKILLELQHLSGSYSYWVNPGGPGASTMVSWTLPDAFSISGPEWPMPERHRSGSITSYVLKGKTFLLYTVTPPTEMKQGDRIVLTGEINTQVCTARACIPTTLSVRKELNVGAPFGSEHPVSDSAFAKALVKFPEPSRGWEFEVYRHGNEAVLSMIPGPEANLGIKEVYFFDFGASGQSVDSQQEQVLEENDGAWHLRLPLAKDGEGAPRPDRLAGVIHAPGGWLAGFSGPTGFLIDLPFRNADGAEAHPDGLPVERQVAIILIFAFLGGLLLNVMPCVFPVVSLKIMGFAKQAHKERQVVFLHGLAYTAGVLLCFWTLSIFIIMIGRGWCAQLQSDWFLFALCHLFLIMAMNMAGIFELEAGTAEAARSLSGRKGIQRSFLTGLLATIISTPCSAPFLGTALAYALSLPAVLSLGVFTLMGLGFAFPYLVLPLVPGWQKLLPKPGAWMDTFRQAMSFPLFGTTCYLFWTMEAMLDEWHFLMLLLGLVLTAMACWMYGKSQKSRIKAPSAGGRRWLAAAVVVLVCGVWMGIPKGGRLLEWQEWSPEAVSRLRREGRAVYVDFTARWCVTCQINKRVWDDPGVVEMIREKRIVLLKADWTLYDERITTTLKNEFNKAAVPVNVLYVPGVREARLLPEILTVGDVAEALRAVGRPTP
ncbi:MAG: thioredoxin family protein [Planctomycetes bacterium]|nr:thioredoxin family protein [Planctomycetota bacterium]